MPMRTHRIGIYGSRNLTQWDLGTNYADTTFDFVPSGNGTPQPRDIVRNRRLQLLPRKRRHGHQHQRPGRARRIAADAWTCALCATSRRIPIRIPATAWI